MSVGDAAYTKHFYQTAFFSRFVEAKLAGVLPCVLYVYCTSVARLDHNNAALYVSLAFLFQRGFFGRLFVTQAWPSPLTAPFPYVVGQTISIPTEHQVASYRAVAETDDSNTKLHPHGTQELWSNVQHRWQIDRTRAIKRTSLAYVYLFLLVAVGSGLQQKHTIQHRNLRSGPVALSAPEPTSTLVRRTSGQLVSKQSNRLTPWITIYLAEGVLSMHSCFATSNSGGLVQWFILFQPQHYRFPADLITRVAIDGRLFNVRLHGISTYHPWAPHITRGFNVPWEVVEKSGEVNATAIVHGAAPTPAITVQAIANFESEASAELELIEGSNDACHIGEAERVTQAPEVNSPLPSRPTSPAFTYEYEAPITEAADPLPPRTRFDPSYPDAIHSFNRPLATNQYIARLYLTRPAQPLPNRTVPADQAAVVRSHLRPVLRGLADRAEERHPPHPLAAESEKGHVMAERAGPSWYRINRSSLPSKRALPERTVGDQNLIAEGQGLQG